MPIFIPMANLALRFLLELCLFAALGYWGFQVGDGTLMKIVLALGAIAVMAIFWGMFMAPRARVKVSPPVQITFEVLTFGAGVLALMAASQPMWGLLLGVAALVNRVLIYVWRNIETPFSVTSET